MVDPGAPGKDGPGEYPPGRITFRTDHGGQPIAVRPNEFITSAEPERVAAAVGEVLAEISGRRNGGEDAGRLEPVGEPAGGVWQLYRIAADDGTDVDVIRVVRGLRGHGIAAQPNHVYFTTSVTASPNMFAPNMFAPNMFAPNMFAPNMFAPNMFAGAAGGGCCCSHGLIDSATVQVPRLAARPVDGPARPATVLKARPRVQVHVIDVVTPGGPAAGDQVAGELEDPGHLVGVALDENADGWADPATGHGDFVCSVVDINSGLTATLWHAADPLGDIDDVALVSALDKVDRHVKDPKGNVRKILNLSLAGYNEDDRPSLVLADQIKRMIAGGWLIVAAAGNNASCRLAWPAALPDVVAVGAYGHCGPAWFSNYGPWVDASAPGVDVAAGYPDLTGLPVRKVDEVEDAAGGTHLLTTQAFDTGWATWSGTSFAAPFVVARLAAALQAEPVATPRAAAVVKALHRVVTDPELPRLPYFGTLVR
jgi:hypothetical protein